MQYRKKDSDSSSEIFLQDKLVLTDREEFNNLVQNFIKSPKENLIINFENTQFLDTSALGSLLLALQTVKDAKKNMVLKNPRSKVKESLNMMNFGSIFQVESGED